MCMAVRTFWLTWMKVGENRDFLLRWYYVPLKTFFHISLNAVFRRATTKRAVLILLVAC